LQVSFHKTATNFRALLRKMTYKEKASYDATPTCTIACMRGTSRRIHLLVSFAKEPYKRNDILQKRSTVRPHHRAAVCASLLVAVVSGYSQRLLSESLLLRPLTEAIVKCLLIEGFVSVPVVESIIKGLCKRPL